MSKFVRNIVIKQEFEGDTVTVTLLPLKYGAALRMRGIVDGTGDAARFVDVLREILPEHLVSFGGLHDAGGSEVESATVFEHAYFAVLLANIGMEWLKESSPKNLPQSA
jgi:hypothetical protein